MSIILCPHKLERHMVMFTIIIQAVLLTSLLDDPFVSFPLFKYSVCVHWYIDAFLSMSMRVIHCALTSFDGNNCSTIEHGLV